MVVLTIIALAGFGMIFGSFANALVWRLHEQDELQEKIQELQASKSSQARDKKIDKLKQQLDAASMSHGRSMCSECHHPLAPKDLVPLLSWLSLGGKCRYCKQPIADPPLLEVGVPVAFVLSYLFWPLALTGYGLVALGFWLVFLIAFATLTLYDIRWFLLPDRIVWPLVAIAGLQVLIHIFVFDGGLDVLVSAFWGVVIASGLFYVLYQVSKGEWIGGGDVKLGIVLGLLTGGPLPALLLIFLASCFGSLASVPMLVRKQLKRTSVIPFGPFLMMAAVVIVLFGQKITDWLTNLILVY
jgi:leader peptidase (prepilin peptidase)/N-methyltransferase